MSRGWSSTRSRSRAIRTTRSPRCSGTAGTRSPTAYDLRTALRSRFYAVVDTAGFDEDRARDWVIVRQMQNALGAVRDAGTDASLPQDWLTRNIAIVKAIQD